MSLDNKKFRNNKTGEVVKVISTFENIAILENKQKTSVQDLMNPNIFTEEIDPSTFFSNQGAYNILADKIKNIPTHLIKDEDTNTIDVKTGYGEEFTPQMNESAVVMTTEEDERAELARKYGVSSDTTSQLQKQNDAFSKILGDDSDELPQVPVQNFDENIQRVEIKRDDVMVKEPQIQKVEVDDPIITMFKKTKRNVEFKVNFDFSDKIPRLDFIEMMEDSYETSMIDFLSDEFTNKILQDPSLIRNKIKEKIKHLVYATPILQNTKKSDEEIQNNKTVHDQITDSVTVKHDALPIEKEPVLSKDLPKKVSTRKPKIDIGDKIETKPSRKTIKKENTEK